MKRNSAEPIDGLLKIFGLNAAIFTIIYVFLIVQGRVPLAHDTFQYLQTQYLYYNEISVKDSIPLWFPFSGQGLAANFYFTPQLNILSPIFYFAGFFLKGMNYLYMFYFLMWAEELFFLLGVVLLSSVYYKDRRTIFFVSATLLGTCIWYPQVWWNFHLFYNIPIILYSLHRCLSTGHFRYLLFAILFFSLSVLGNFIYAGIFISFVLICYVIPLSFTDLNGLKSFVKENTNLRNIIALMASLMVLAVSFYYVVYGSDEIAFLGVGRDASGQNSLEIFLHYGGSIGWSKFKEIFLRYGNSIDITLYGGFLFVPLVFIAAIYERGRVSYVVGFVSLVLFLFSVGAVVSHLFFYLYPFGKVFRHIGLTATVFKLFIIFYAGFGLDRFIELSEEDKGTVKRMALFLAATIVIIAIVPVLVNNSLFWYISKIESKLIGFLIYAIPITGLTLILVSLANKMSRKHLVSALIVLTVVELFSYKYSLVVARMPRASQELIGLFKPYDYVFSASRLNAKRLRFNDMNERARIIGFAEIIGTRYNTTDMFTYTDFIWSPYRTDFILRPIKDFLDSAKKFNYSFEAFKKYSGLGYQKLSVFEKLNVVDDDLSMGRIFGSEGFTGDMLFTTIEDIKGKGLEPGALVGAIKPEGFQNKNERIPADINVEEFSSNTLRVNVSIKAREGSHFFLYYSDAYHPHWKTYVDGKEAPVIKSNIGYKSVIIPQGTSEVTFRFGTRFYTVSIACSLAIMLAILVSVVYLFKVGIVGLAPKGSRKY